MKCMKFIFWYVFIFCFKVGLRGGNYIAEITRVSLKYDESKMKLSDLKHKLAKVEEQMIPGQNEMDKDRYVKGAKDLCMICVKVKQIGQLCQDIMN